MSFTWTAWLGSSEVQETWQTSVTSDSKNSHHHGKSPQKSVWFQMQFPWEDTAPLSRCDFMFVRDNSWGELGIHHKLQRATGTVNSWVDHADTLKTKRKGLYLCTNIPATELNADFPASLLTLMVFIHWLWLFPQGYQVLPSGGQCIWSGVQ